MLDCVSGYTFTQALQVGRALDELNFHWFEEPIPDRHVDTLNRLALELSVPILATETIGLRELPHYISQHAVDLALGDVFIKAGITGLRKASALCELFGFNLEIHALYSPLWDIANLHVACSVNNCEFLELHDPMFRFGLKHAPLDMDADGYLHLPTNLGWAWNWTGIGLIITLLR